MVPDITVCLPCYGRPLRTRRMLECLQGQTKSAFELIIVGDGCIDFVNMATEAWFRDWIEKMQFKGHFLTVIYSEINMGGYGAGAINMAIEHARGQFCCFVNNDDILAPEHVEFCYNSITEVQKFYPDIGFIYNRTMINSGQGFFERIPTLKFGCVGHSELVVRTEFLKQMPPHEPVYGQDWLLIENMLKKGRSFPGNIPFPTYYIMSTPNYLETGID